MCSVITPPGTLRQLKRTSCPSLSAAMAVYSTHSPVAGLKKGRKPVVGLACLGHDHQAFALSRAAPGGRAGRRPARSWKPAAAVPRSRTPAAMPVVTASAEPDMVATRITGPTVSAQPTGR